MPSALPIPLNMNLYDWGFAMSRAASRRPRAGDAARRGDRRLVSIGGMVYVRGHARDFDHWAEKVAGWGFAECFPVSSAWKTGQRRGYWRGSGGARIAARIATQSLRRLR
jgi:choline dehydrogenase